MSPSGGHQTSDGLCDHYVDHYALVVILEIVISSYVSLAQIPAYIKKSPTPW